LPTRKSAFRLVAANMSPRIANRALPCGVENEYFRCGAWTYLAGLDVHHARIFGRCEAKNGIAPFDRLVEQLMTRPPYNDAGRVFWIVDNCSSHRGLKAAERLRNRYSHLKLVHARSIKSQKDEPDFFWGEGQMLKVLQSIGATDDRHPTSWENRFMGMVAGAILMVSFRRHGDEQVRRFSQL